MAKVKYSTSKFLQTIMQFDFKLKISCKDMCKGILVKIISSERLLIYEINKLRGTSMVVPYCYLFLLSVFILWFNYFVSDIFCNF